MLFVLLFAATAAIAQTFTVTAPYSIATSDGVVTNRNATFSGTGWQAIGTINDSRIQSDVASKIKLTYGRDIYNMSVSMDATGYSSSRPSVRLSSSLMQLPEGRYTTVHNPYFIVRTPEGAFVSKHFITGTNQDFIVTLFEGKYYIEIGYDSVTFDQPIGSRSYEIYPTKTIVANSTISMPPQSASRTYSIIDNAGNGIVLSFSNAQIITTTSNPDAVIYACLDANNDQACDSQPLQPQNGTGNTTETNECSLYSVGVDNSACDGDCSAGEQLGVFAGFEGQCSEGQKKIRIYGISTDDKCSMEPSGSLVNNDFEATGGWLLDKSHIIDSTGGYSGRKFVYSIGPGTTNSTSVTVASGQDYRVSAFISGAGRVIAVDNAGNDLCTSHLASGSSWKEINCTFTPQTNVIKVHLVSEGVARFDMISVSPSSAEASMQGIEFLCTGRICKSVWNVPSLPSACSGKTIRFTRAEVLAGNLLETTSNNVIGSLSFQSMRCTDGTTMNSCSAPDGTNQNGMRCVLVNGATVLVNDNTCACDIGIFTDTAAGVVAFSMNFENQQSVQSSKDPESVSEIATSIGFSGSGLAIVKTNDAGRSRITVGTGLQAGKYNVSFMLKSNAANAAMAVVNSASFIHPGDNQWRKYDAIVDGPIENVVVEVNSTSFTSIDELVIKKIEAQCIQACADNTPKGRCSGINGLYCDPQSFRNNAVKPYLTEALQCRSGQAGGGQNNTNGGQAGCNNDGICQASAENAVNCPLDCSTGDIFTSTSAETTETGVKFTANADVGAVSSIFFCESSKSRADCVKQFNADQCAIGQACICRNSLFSSENVCIAQCHDASGGAYAIINDTTSGGLAVSNAFQYSCPSFGVNKLQNILERFVSSHRSIFDLISIDRICLEDQSSSGCGGRSIQAVQTELSRKIEALNMLTSDITLFRKVIANPTNASVSEAVSIAERDSPRILQMLSGQLNITTLSLDAVNVPQTATAGSSLAISANITLTGEPRYGFLACDISNSTTAARGQCSMVSRQTRTLGISVSVPSAGVMNVAACSVNLSFDADCDSSVSYDSADVSKTITIQKQGLFIANVTSSQILTVNERLDVSVQAANNGPASKIFSNCSVSKPNGNTTNIVSGNSIIWPGQTVALNSSVVADAAGKWLVRTCALYSIVENLYPLNESKIYYQGIQAFNEKTIVKFGNSSSKKRLENDGEGFIRTNFNMTGQSSQGFRLKGGLKYYFGTWVYLSEGITSLRMNIISAGLNVSFRDADTSKSNSWQLLVADYTPPQDMDAIFEMRASGAEKEFFIIDEPYFIEDPAEKENEVNVNNEVQVNPQYCFGQTVCQAGHECIESPSGNYCQEVRGVTISSPETASGIATIEFLVSGTSRRMDYATIEDGDDCADAPLAEVRKVSTSLYRVELDTNNYTDRDYRICAKATFNDSATARAEKRMTINNYEFAIDQSRVERSAKAGHNATALIILSNKGREDNFVISFRTGKDGWTPSFLINNQSVSSVQVQRNKKANISLTVYIPFTANDGESTNATLSVQSSSSQETRSYTFLPRASGKSNDPVRIDSYSSRPNPVIIGSSVTFTARLIDPEDGEITASACADLACNRPYCEMLEAEPDIFSCSWPADSLGTKEVHIVAFDVDTAQKSFVRNTFIVQQLSATRVNETVEQGQCSVNTQCGNSDTSCECSANTCVGCPVGERCVSNQCKRITVDDQPRPADEPKKDGGIPFYLILIGLIVILAPIALFVYYRASHGDEF